MTVTIRKYKERLRLFDWQKPEYELRDVDVDMCERPWTSILPARSCSRSSAWSDSPMLAVLALRRALHTAQGPGIQ